MVVVVPSDGHSSGCEEADPRPDEKGASENDVTDGGWQGMEQGCSKSKTEEDLSTILEIWSITRCNN